MQASWPPLMPPMSLLHTATALAVACGALLLLGAALHDVAARTVPNRLAAAVALDGLAMQAMQGALPAAAASAAAVFGFAALCWRHGWMGGGDVKLLAAAALLVAPAFVPMLLCATALAGGLLAVPYLIARRRLSAPDPIRPDGLLRRALRAERWRLRRGGPMPYAVAIASGALFVLHHGAPP